MILYHVGFVTAGDMVGGSKVGEIVFRSWKKLNIFFDIPDIAHRIAGYGLCSV